MNDHARFDVRVAGGLAIAKNVGLVVAAAKAAAAAKQGYRVWIREKTAVSWAAETIVVARYDGELVVRTIDNAPERYRAQFERLIKELEAA